MALNLSGRDVQNPISCEIYRGEKWDILYIRNACPPTDLISHAKAKKKEQKQVALFNDHICRLISDLFMVFVM